MRVYTFDMDYKKFFVQRLKAARLERGFTQDRLAQLSGIHLKTIAKYETGIIIPTVETLKKLAEALEVSADYFVFEQAKMDGVPKIKDPVLYDRYFVLESLSEEERAAVLVLLNALITSSKIREITSVPAAESADPKKKSVKKAAVG